jgi:hypothetical protein
LGLAATRRPRQTLVSVWIKQRRKTALAGEPNRPSKGQIDMVNLKITDRTKKGDQRVGRK